MDGQTKITYGGWYQRTTLHLSEIYDLMALGKSSLDLDQNKISDFKNNLEIETITREAGYLEFVKAKTKEGIEIRYYEDGLYILDLDSDDIKNGSELLENYFNKKLNPAISYIFSLGAPTPKVLANIKTTHPIVVTVITEEPANFQIDSSKFGSVYSTIGSGDVVVHKAPQYLFVVSKQNLASIRELVEMQIFFREFKDQLGKYLNIHRRIWEEISEIKERGIIGGNEIEPLRSHLDSYQKTISLISSRINQMGSYIRTRSSIAKGFELEDYLVKLFQFKFEILTDTLDYIKEVWKMTTDYMSSAIQIIVEIKNQSTAKGIQSLQLITSIGVVAGILGYISKTELPHMTPVGGLYFALIMAITWLVNYSVTRAYKNKKYKLKFAERASDI